MTGHDESARPVVLFDGVCNVCNAWVRFVLDHEADGELRFASLQSEAGSRLLERHAIDADGIDSIVYIERGTALVYSDAVLRICGRLRAPWRWLVVARVVPRVLRDAAYRLFARSRYRLFGRRDACAVPSPATRDRFLEDDPPAPAGGAARP